MTITTNVEQVKLHIMTEQQYDDSAKSDSELYVITDATAMPMDNELSLSSENPVKNNVIKERFDEVQTELDDKVNKSVVWNKLNRAYGWTYKKQLEAGSMRVIVGTESHGFVISESQPCYEVLESKNCNPYSSYICLDNSLYRIYYHDQIISLNKELDNVSCFAQYTSNSSGYSAISNGNLYYGSYSSELIDSGGWTKISSYEHSTSDVFFGIKNDNLYYITRTEYGITLKDSSGIWSDVIGYCNSSYGGLGIKDNKLYLLTINGPELLSNETGWNLSLITDIYLNDNSYRCIIKDNKLYKIDGYNKQISIMDETEQWIKVNNSYGLTSSGKLYMFYNNNIIQIGTDNTWTDLSIGNVAVNNGDVYMLLDTDITRITTTGDITKVYGYLNTNESNNFFGSCVCWSGNPTEDVHSIYTVAAPSVDFDTYSDVNLTKYGTITSVSSSPYAIADEHYTYNRDSSIDGVFTGISPDSSKQLMSMSDFLKCFTE